jgi:hypothetical protein
MKFELPILIRFVPLDLLLMQPNAGDNRRAEMLIDKRLAHCASG